MRTPPRLSRRTAVGGAVVLTALAATGCTKGQAAAPTGTATSSPTPARASVTPDVALAATVLRGEQAMLDQVVATARRHPALAQTLEGTRSTHRAHVRLMRRAVPDGTPSRAPARPGRVPRRPGLALAALARAESRLSADGQRDAVRARSGSFARVLASMSAASAQQAARLSADRR